MNGAFAECFYVQVRHSLSGKVVKRQSLMLFCFPSECLIKSLINPRNVTKMKMTFGTWMKDTALLNDERIWVAEHFSGGLGQKIKSFQDQIRILCTSATDPHEIL